MALWKGVRQVLVPIMVFVAVLAGGAYLVVHLDNWFLSELMQTNA